MSCLISAGYTMYADVLTEERGYDPDTGEKTHRWEFSKRIKCNVVPYIDGGVRGLGSTEFFAERYRNQENARVETKQMLNKRDRVTNVRNAKTGNLVWFEEIGGQIEPIVFNVDGSNPIINPITGKVEQWIMGVSRAEVRQ